MCTEMNLQEELEVLDIPMADGTTRSYAVLDEFEIEETAYIVLAEIDEEDALSEDTLFFRYAEEGDEVVLTPIEDEDELSTVIAAHLDLYDEEPEDDMEEVEVELETIDIPLEDGGVLPCAIIDEFEIDDVPYIVVSPIEGDTLSDEELYFRCTTEGEDVIVSVIEDEEEMAFAVMAHEDFFDAEDEEEE